MSLRIKIRVTLNGNDAKRELMFDGRKVEDFTYDDAAAFALGLAEALRNQPKEPVQVEIERELITLSHQEAIETAMQVMSSLRW